MRTIYKYPLPTVRPGSDFTIEMPGDAWPHHFGVDPNGELCVWAEVDTDLPMTAHTFVYYFTGQEIDTDDASLIGAAIRNSLVFHLYAR